MTKYKVSLEVYYIVWADDESQAEAIAKENIIEDLSGLNCIIEQVN